MPKQLTSRINPLLLDIVIAAWLLAIFHFLGNSADTTFFSSSAFAWMITRWRDSTFYTGDYSHGWLIPVISVYALWGSRENLHKAARNVWWPALVISGGALLLHVAGSRAQLPRVSLLALMVLMWSIPTFLAGNQIGRILAFPVFYLFFCIPLNFLDSVAFPLRILATNMSVFFLNGLGLPAEATGTAIISPGGTFALEVADPCSGIKSLLALTAMTVAYAYFFQEKAWKRIILVFMSAPLAVAGNIARIIALAIFATWFGQDRAFDFYHDYSGYIVFIVAVLMMMCIHKGIDRIAKAISTSNGERQTTD